MPQAPVPSFKVRTVVLVPHMVIVAATNHTGTNISATDPTVAVGTADRAAAAKATTAKATAT